ncbi:hypothetical protein [Glaciihabitans sp. dw_435]|uniref:hypothetical protein n=1 Tax=Glaciihabitans sp. dw_435 TaxID=2720081 RepID=UPI001BD44997|nr:hypothetical protein [Glaciihabitans sp. dw_435]
MKIRVGEEVVIENVRYVVSALSAVSAALCQIDTGVTKEILISELVRQPLLKAETAARHANDVREIAILQYLDASTRAEADFWLTHLRELESRIEAGADASEATVTKLAELAALGRPITDRTLRRKRYALRQSGIAGLIDHRQQRVAGERRRIDERVVAALAEVMESQRNASTGTRTRLIALTAQMLAQRFGVGEVDLPPAGCRRTQFLVS